MAEQIVPLSLLLSIEFDFRGADEQLLVRLALQHSYSCRQLVLLVVDSRTESHGGRGESWWRSSSRSHLAPSAIYVVNHTIAINQSQTLLLCVFRHSIHLPTLSVLVIYMHWCLKSSRHLRHHFLLLCIPPC